MKTTYTLREGNEWLLLTAADNGETKYCEEFWNSQDCGECLAMLQDGMTAEELEGRTNTFFDAEEAAEKIAEYDGLPVIADEKGTYPERAHSTGEKALESAAWHRDPESVISACEYFSELAELVDNYSSSNATRGNENDIFLSAAEQAFRILCNSECDLWTECAECIEKCGQSLAELRYCSVTHWRTEDPETGQEIDCSEEEAERRELSLEFYSLSQKTHHTAERLAWLMPDDTRTRHSSADFENDSVRFWYSWKLDPVES